MPGPLGWIKSRLAQAFDKAIVNFLAGAFLTLIAVILGTGFFSSLSAEFPVPLVLIIALSLFALIGVLFVGEALWTSVTISRRPEFAPYPRDELLEAATINLLDQLAKVEVGLQTHNERLVSEFSSDLVALFDQWETAILPYASELNKRQMEEIREGILRQHLPHGKEKAEEWVRAVKDITNEAREQVAAQR